MYKIHTIDLYFQSEKHSIGAFLIETEKGPILIETGPESTWECLEKGIQDLGYQVEDIQHVLLTHIHFDHAGAAWKFAKNGAKIYVHPIGIPHLANPEKLWNSAKMIYTNKMEMLWGTMESIPEEQLIPVDEGDTIDFGDAQIKVWYTPGHAVHHNAYQIDDIIFTGDVAGVRIGDGPVAPPCPPPDINVELWKKSIHKLKNLKPQALYLTHFSLQYNPQELLTNLEIKIDDWANFIKPFYDNQTPPEEIVPQFMAYTRSQFLAEGLHSEEIQTYELANPSWMSVNGLLRYWKLKEQGRI
ncbi:MBL fold metallo-hydrolase [Flavobacterium frigoris]|uniref:Metallo-beta-lactamase protein n=1 Tax=Flavobacterium frigoris (strain PS1) TaxID=1086011 RepID=H7FS91_FLAFP|nr:MBL fold metallo-hydrolase [Flavobacterium frigoris]EIA08588.1 metallo-beta-lactamase protein [Flavobacterium frigoris PS1]